MDAANEHERLLELCRTLGVRTVLETHGHWDHIQAIPAVRDAGYEVGGHRRGRGHAAQLRLPPRGRRGDRGGAAAAADAAHPGPHAGLDVVPRGGHAAAVQRRHPLPRRPRRHPLRGGATSTPSSGRSKTGCSGCSAATPWFCPATATTPPSGPSRPAWTSGRPGDGEAPGSGLSPAGRADDWGDPGDLRI